MSSETPQQVEADSTTAERPKANVASKPISVAVPKRSRARRRLTILRHGLKTWLMSRGWATRLLLALNNLGLVAGPLYAAGWKFSVGYSIWWSATGLIKAWRELSPARLAELRRSNYERSLSLFAVIQKFQRLHRARPSDEELHEYRVDVLRLISSFARDHRGDRSGGSIFSNLLVSEGEEMVVVARDAQFRESPGRAPKNSTAAFRTFGSGTVQIVGDLYEEFPETPLGKRYRSIVTIPVKLGRTTIGVVSIDSAHAYHFDGQDEDLVKELYPYVAMLAWTLDPGALTPPGE